MILAWIDGRPFLFIALLPLVILIGWVFSKFVFRNSPLIPSLMMVSFFFIALYQFIFYGPFIDRKLVVHTPTKFFMRDSGTVAFMFPESFGFPGILSRDADVLEYIKTRKNNDVDVAVEPTYDFGKARGMNLGFAYVDGILFKPMTEEDIMLQTTKPTP
jgi:hypothetical protein